jgi:hypothetical protein
VLLIVVYGRDGTAAVADYLRTGRAIVYPTSSPAGCVRVFTAVGPDIVVVPRDFSPR